MNRRYPSNHAKKDISLKVEYVPLIYSSIEEECWNIFNFHTMQHFARKNNSIFLRNQIVISELVCFSVSGTLFPHKNLMGLRNLAEIQIRSY